MTPNEGLGGSPGATSPFPLDDSHYDLLHAVCESTQQIQEVLNRCKECGLPVDDSIERLQRQHKLACDLKRVFFPDRP